MTKVKNYSGRDLSPEFKSWARKEFNRIRKVLTARGCTNVQLSYGFYYWSGFFTSPSGQVYYLSCSDVRYFDYSMLLIRTAESYTDYRGGSNQYIEPQNLSTFYLK
jgi:hypothetical protein